MVVLYYEELKKKTFTERSFFVLYIIAVKWDIPGKDTSFLQEKTHYITYRARF